MKYGTMWKNVFGTVLTVAACAALVGCMAKTPVVEEKPEDKSKKTPVNKARRAPKDK